MRFYVKNVQKIRGEGTKRIHLPMDVNTTIESLENYLMPFLDETEMKCNKIIMDGARCHTTNDTQE